MEKSNLLNELLNDIKYFDDVTLEDFCLLNSLEADELDLFNDKVSQVTPLLNQICSYALANKFIDDINLDLISDTVAPNKLEKCLSIFQKCEDYIEILIEDDCKHPSVSNVVNCINGSFSYEQLYECLTDFIPVVDNSTQNILVDLMYNADEVIQEVYDNLLLILLNCLQNNPTISTKQLLVLLNRYGKSCAMLCIIAPQNGLIYNHNNSDTYVSCFNDGNNFGLNQILVNSLLSLANIIKIVEDYEKRHNYEFEEDDELKDLIDEMKDCYSIYQSYKYKYYKDTYKEQKLLKKCKKL